jgi:hypothetical protein
MRSKHRSYGGQRVWMSLPRALTSRLLGGHEKDCGANAAVPRSSTQPPGGCFQRYQRGVARLLGKLPREQARARGSVSHACAST